MPEGPTSQRPPAIDRLGAADGPLHGGPSRTLPTPQLAGHGGESLHLGSGGS